MLLTKSAMAKSTMAKIGLYGTAILALLGCDPVSSATDALSDKIDQREDSFITKRDQKLKEEVSRAPAIIEGDTVMLDKSQLTSVKTARYQPSFSLEGVIKPILHTPIYPPDGTAVQEMLVKAGEVVEKDQPIAIMTATHTGTPTPLTAPHAGVISEVMDGGGKENAPLFYLSDESKYQFVSRLPSYLKPHIQIGNSVELTIEGNTFGGQVTNATIDHTSFEYLDVQVQIPPKKDNLQALRTGQLVKGVIEYGQIEVGALLPDYAIMGDDLNPLDLSALYVPPHKPSAPITASAWVVKQNAHLQLAPIHVIEYQPTTRRFLVSGITDDSLIVLTTLPKNADGRQVVID